MRQPTWRPTRSRRRSRDCVLIDVLRYLIIVSTPTLVQAARTSRYLNLELQSSRLNRLTCDRRIQASSTHRCPTRTVGIQESIGACVLRT